MGSIERFEGSREWLGKGLFWTECRMVLEKIRSLKARRPKNRPLATGGSYPAVADGKLHATFVRSVDFSRLPFARGLKPTLRGNRAESQKTARGFLIASLFRDHGT